MFSEKTSYEKIKKFIIKRLELHLVPKNKISIHRKYLHILPTEIYKSIINNSAEFMHSYFNFKNILHELRHRSPLKLPSARST